MDRELEGKLAERFPSFFRNLRQKGTCMFWGVEHETGWFDLLWRLCERIEGYVKDKPDLDFRFSQIKEKFTTLRAYFDGGEGDRTLYDIIDEYESESASICEFCGSREDVFPYGTGWWKTRCLKCWDSYADEGKVPRFGARVLAEIRENGLVKFEEIAQYFFAKRRKAAE